MLGWVLKRGLETASGARLEPVPDDTQIEQPDTPAPVFAARAFRTALFGTPEPKNETRRSVAPGPSRHTDSTNARSDVDESKPLSKPVGILLTPGTGTARRKRVSFGHDVGGKASKKASKSGTPDECPGKFPSSWIDGDGEPTTTRPRTKLTAALEKSRGQGSKSEALRTEDDEAWEEVDELERDADITVDLNEPRSRSGTYWKTEFKRYQEDAKVEMDKLVKYKQLAKSYAKEKDAEAMWLKQRLKEEKENVAKMESQITQLAGRIARGQTTGTDMDKSALIQDLTKQTAQAVEYRARVEELEALVKEGQQRAERQRQAVSPRTQKTLLDTNRELRRAKEQVKELGDTKEEVRRLKSELRSAQQRERSLESENRKLERELSKVNEKMEQLEVRLKHAEQESKQKGNDLRDLRREHDNLRRKGGQPLEGGKTTRSHDLGGIDGSALPAKPLTTVDESRSWKNGFADLQAKTKAEQDARNLKREESRKRFEAGIASPKSLALNSRRNGLRGLDVQTDNAPRAVDILENTFTSPYTARQQQDMGWLDSPSLRRSQKKALSTVLEVVNRGQISTGRTGSPARISPSPRRGTGAALPDILGDGVVDLSKQRLSRTTRGITHDSRFSSRPTTSGSDMPVIDLLEGKFPPLGALDADNSAARVVSSKRGIMPASRQAAAIARLDQRRAERRALSAAYNKENVRP